MSEPSWDALRRLVEKVDRQASFEVAAMPGGASSRRYFRIRLGRRTAVAMFVPGPPTHELHRDQAEGRSRWPFLEVRDLLFQRGIRVPQLYAEATADGWLLLEDLGDLTVAALLDGSPDRKEEVYVRAVHDLAVAQKALATLPEGSVVRTRAFDAALLGWELEHFWEWGVLASGRAPSPADRRVFEEGASHLAATIAAWPRGFVHRDYQSRNLMVVRDPVRDSEYELVWIDFQDALLGPRTYDLVALLCDSYQSFPEEFVQRRLAEYARLSGQEEAIESIRREFDLVTVQRKLKDAGRFVFIHRQKGDPSYLPFVEPTLAKVRSALDRLTAEPELGEMARLLARTLTPRQP